MMRPSFPPTDVICWQHPNWAAPAPSALLLVIAICLRARPRSRSTGRALWPFIIDPRFHHCENPICEHEHGLALRWIRLMKVLLRMTFGPESKANADWSGAGQVDRRVRLLIWCGGAHVAQRLLDFDKTRYTVAHSRRSLHFASARRARNQR
jgi:hypothetical protein